MHIGELKRPPRKTKKRIGRGPGSGNGKTSGRGQKGQHSRAGSGHRPWFEGGQMPLQRRLPKRGFKPISRNTFQLVNVSALDRFESGQTVNATTLMNVGLIKTDKKPVKILGNGDIAKNLVVHADAFSKSAQEKIANAGGETHVSAKAATA